MTYARNFVKYFTCTRILDFHNCCIFTDKEIETQIGWLFLPREKKVLRKKSWDWTQVIQLLEAMHLLLCWLMFLYSKTDFGKEKNTFQFTKKKRAFKAQELHKYPNNEGKKSLVQLIFETSHTPCFFPTTCRKDVISENNCPLLF